MDIIDTQFFSGLLSIVLIDLVLGGDNAILIALATRNLVGTQRKKAIFWGVLGAVAVRSLLTIIAVYLLKIPLIQLIGGVLLIWIAYKLLADNSEHDENVNSGNNLRDAIKTIIIADMLMGIDNVLAIAGAAHGNILLVILGLFISIPIIVWGSSIILKFINKFPIIIYIGAAVIAYTAGSMIVEDSFIHENVILSIPVLEWIIPIGIICIVMSAGFLKRKKIA